MSTQLSERFSVLRDEALNCAELGDDAPGGEVFEAILACLSHLGEADGGLDLSLQDAISRRLAWGENASAVALDNDSVCQRLLAAIPRSFPEASDATQVVAITVQVACTASRHIARLAVQQASKERALERREMMVQRQIAAAISQQDELISEFTNQLKP